MTDCIHSIDESRLANYLQAHIEGFTGPLTADEHLPEDNASSERALKVHEFVAPLAKMAKQITMDGASV